MNKTLPLVPLEDREDWPKIREEMELIEKVKRGNNQAFAILHSRHGKLIGSIAGKFRNLGRETFKDLLQEGNLGLFEAIERFDWRKGYRLSAYAIWWIRHYIYKAVADRRMPYLSDHTRKRIKKILKAEEKFLMLRKELTLEGISKETNLDLKMVRKMYLYIEGQKTLSLDWTLRESEATVEEVLDLGENEETLILSQIFTEEAEEKIEELSVRGKYKIIFKLRLGLIELEEAKEEIDKLPVSENLKKTYKERIDLLIESNNLVGLNGKRCYILEEMGEIFELSRERINQIVKQMGEELGKVVFK